MKTNPNDAAFARPVGENQLNNSPSSFGLTKLEYFAAIALQGLLANDASNNLAARDAVKCAKLLIDELDKEQK